MNNISHRPTSFPNRQAKKHDLEDGGGEDGADDALNDDLMLQVPQALIIDSDLAFGNHELAEKPHQRRDSGAVCSFLFVRNALPRQLLAAGEEQQ